MEKYEKRLNDKRKKDAIFILFAGLIAIVIASSEIWVYFDEKNNNSLGKFESFKLIFSIIFIYAIGIIAVIYSIYAYKKKIGRKYDRLYKMAYIIDHGETIFENEYVKIVDSIIINKTDINKIAYLDEIFDVIPDECISTNGDSHAIVRVLYHITGAQRNSGFAITVGFVPLEVANKLVNIIKLYCPVFNGEKIEVVNNNFENNSYEEVFGDNHYIPSNDIRQKAYKDSLMIEKKYETVDVRIIDIMKAASNSVWMNILWIVELGGILLIFDMFFKKKFNMFELCIYILFVLIPLIVFVITCIVTNKKVKTTKL